MPNCGRPELKVSNELRAMLKPIDPKLRRITCFDSTTQTILIQMKHKWWDLYELENGCSKVKAGRPGAHQGRPTSSNGLRQADDDNDDDGDTNYRNSNGQQALILATGIEYFVDCYWCYFTEIRINKTRSKLICYSTNPKIVKWCKIDAHVYFDRVSNCHHLTAYP